MRRQSIHAMVWAIPLMLLACGGAEEVPEADEPPATTSPPAAAPSATAPGTFMDPNSASRDQLMTVPGVDAALADALVAGRPYANMTAVDAVVGSRLTEEQKDVFYERVWMPVDLNSASEAEIMLIPRIGGNMAHEFEEYRPYDRIERFRREIGKYVDSVEVARLERYVRIP